MKITAGYEVMSTDCDIALCITKHVLRFGKKTCSKTKKKEKRKKRVINEESNALFLELESISLVRHSRNRFHIQLQLKH